MLQYRKVIQVTRLTEINKIFLFETFFQFLVSIKEKKDANRQVFNGNKF